MIFARKADVSHVHFSKCPRSHDYDHDGGQPYFKYLHNREWTLLVERQQNETYHTRIAVSLPPARNSIPLHKAPQSSLLPKQHSKAARVTPALPHSAGR